MLLTAVGDDGDLCHSDENLPVSLVEGTPPAPHLCPVTDLWALSSAYRHWGGGDLE